MHITITKKLQNVILLVAFLYQASGMCTDDLWASVQQKLFTRWINKYLNTKRERISSQIGLTKRWLALSEREKENGTGLVLIGHYLEMVSHELLQKKLQHVEQGKKRKQMVQGPIPQEEKRIFTIAQRKHDRLQRQQELRHQQKIKLPRNQKLPQVQRRMQVAHRKKR